MCWARASLVRHNRSCTPENPAKPPPSRTRGPRCVFAARVETRAVPQASGGVTCVFACPARLQRRHSRQRRSRLRHSSGCPTEMPDGNGQVCRHPPPGAVCRRVGGSFHCCHAASAAPSRQQRSADSYSAGGGGGRKEAADTAQRPATQRRAVATQPASTMGAEAWDEPERSFSSTKREPDWESYLDGHTGLTYYHNRL